jgi:BlaI family transcriptional regulator, penicillinase repressor
MTDPQLSDLQLALMRVLWDRQEATAAEVHERVCEHDRALAPTTVATLLQRLEKRGLVSHSLRGRTYVYRAEVPEHEVRRTMLAKLTQFFFAGDPAALVSHLTGGGRLDAHELEVVRGMIAARRESEDEGSS